VVRAGLGHGIRTAPSRADGFIEPPVTRQPAAACAVIRPEDKALFSNCLTVIEVLRALQACKESSTCPEITLPLCAAPLLLLFSGERLTDVAWAQLETSRSAHRIHFAVGDFAPKEELTTR